MIKDLSLARVICLLILAFASNTYSVAAAPIDITGKENGIRLGTQYSIWLDKTGQATLDQAIQAKQDFTPQNKTGSTGLKGGALWSHFHLRNNSDKTITVALEYVDHQLIHLHAYQRNADQVEFAKIADLSMYKPFDERPVLHHRFVVPATIAPGSTAEFFFRFGSENRGFVFPNLRISSMENLQATQSVETWLVAMFAGGLVLIAIIALVGGISMGEKFFFCYFVYALAKISVWPTILGFTHQFVITENFHWTYMSITGAFTLFMGVLFARVFLETKKHLPKMDYVLLFMLANAALLILAALIREKTLAHVTITLALLLTPVMVIVGLMRARQGSIEAAVYAGAWAVLTWGLFSQAMRDLGVLEHNFINYYWPPIASYSEMVVILVAIGIRLRVLRQTKDEAEKRYTQHLEHTKEELEKLVAERTQDLEIAKSQAEYEASVDALTGINNRRSFLQQAQIAFEHAQKHGESMHILMFDIDRFKEVNDTHGHAVGDIALTAFANAFKKEIRDSDIFGRIGGEEFSLVLIGSKETVEHTTKRLCDRVRSTTIAANDTEINLTTSVGIAKLSDEANLRQLMSAADGALYKAKQNGRDQYVFASEACTSNKNI